MVLESNTGYTELHRMLVEAGDRSKVRALVLGICCQCLNGYRSLMFSPARVTWSDDSADMIAKP